MIGLIFLSKTGDFWGMEILALECLGTVLEGSYDVTTLQCHYDGYMFFRSATLLLRGLTFDNSMNHNVLCRKPLGKWSKVGPIDQDLFSQPFSARSAASCTVVSGLYTNCKRVTRLAPHDLGIWNSLEPNQVLKVKHFWLFLGLCLRNEKKLTSHSYIRWFQTTWQPQDLLKMQGEAVKQVLSISQAEIQLPEVVW